MHDTAELEALRERARELSEYLSETYDVDVFVAGSIATGLILPGERDFDFVLSEGNPDRYRMLYRRLSSEFDETPAYPADCDKHIFWADALGEQVHLALLIASKADLVQQAYQRVNRLSPEEKAAIIRRKARAKKAWPFRRHRYNRFKRRLDRELGIPRFPRAQLPASDSSA